MKHRSFFIAMLIAASLLAIVDVLWGLLALGFVDTKDALGVAFCVTSFLPFLALLLSFKKIRVALASSILAFVGSWSVMLAVNARECMHGQCTSANPFLIAIGSLVGPPVILSLLVLFCVFAAYRLQLYRQPISPEGI